MRLHWKTQPLEKKDSPNSNLTGTFIRNGRYTIDICVGRRPNNTGRKWVPTQLKKSQWGKVHLAKNLTFNF